MNRLRTARFWLALWCGACGTPVMAPASAVTLDGYAALVNDRVITIGDVLEYVQPVEEQIRRERTGSALEEELRAAFLAGRRALIEQALILEEFKARGYELPERAVDERAEAFLRERFEGDRTAFLALLAREGMTMEEWREGLREQLIVFRMRHEAMEGGLTASPAAVHAAYEANLNRHRSPPQVHLRMILLQGQEEDEERHAIKRAEAERLLEALRKGADFAELAREHSEGPQARRGGDAGWLSLEALRPELRAAAETLPAGSQSGVMEAGGNFYLLMIEGRREEQVTPFEEVKELYEGELIRAEQERRYRAWIERLEQRHFIREL